MRIQINKFLYFCDTTNNYLNMKHYTEKYIYTIMCIASLLLICDCKNSKTDPDTILSTIQQEADIVTTELTIRKIAYYDSSLHEHISITDPSTWKYGERKCMVP